MSEDPKQWDLTKREIKELRTFQGQRVATEEILQALLKQAGRNAEKERILWDTIARNHKITLTLGLVADSVLGKVWVKGEVPELDKAFNIFNSEP